jgi:hypothetical protein
MSDEPKPSMGDQLRTFARQRREALGDPVTLGSTVRQRLQDEVERTFPKAPVSTAGTSADWLTAFWLRLGFAGGILAVLTLAVAYWIPREPRGDAPLTSIMEKSAAMPPSTSEGLLVRDASNAPATARELTAEEIKRLPPIALAETSLTLTATSGDARRNGQLPGQLARSSLLMESKARTKSTDQPPVAASVPTLVTADAVTASSETLPDRIMAFKRVPSSGLGGRGAGSPPPPAVFESFELQQRGTMLRVVEGDGSVYQGNFSIAGGSRGPGQLREGATFRVTGMNRHLGQSIVFTGRLRSATAAPKDNAPSGSLTLQGKVVTEAKSEWRIDATESPR